MLYRPLLTLTTASTLLVTLLCLVLIVAAQRSHDRLTAVTEQFSRLSTVTQASTPKRRDVVESAIERLRTQAYEFDVDAPFADATPDSGAAVQSEVAREGKAVLATLEHQSELDLWLTLTLALMLAIGTPVIAWQLRRHVLVPLDMLNTLLNTITERRYVMTDVDDISPALRPLFESYNEMVRRISLNDDQQAQREAELRTEIHAATRSLMQQQLTLVRGQRLAQTGELAAQIAHDMRNPLAGILAAVENLRHDADNDDHRERLQMVSDEVKRLARQLDGLGSVARQQAEPSRDIDVCTATESVLSLAAWQFPDAIELGCDLPQDLIVHAPEGNFRQALLNLIINAARSIGEASGRIEVLHEVDQHHITISVCDSGAGFSAQALESGARTFTSYSAGGTGLGLAAVRRFITDLGGELSIANREQGGAKVSMKFPKGRDNV